jgi:hypothetical protein
MARMIGPSAETPKTATCVKLSEIRKLRTAFQDSLYVVWLDSRGGSEVTRRGNVPLAPETYKGFVPAPTLREMLVWCNKVDVFMPFFEDKRQWQTFLDNPDKVAQLCLYAATGGKQGRVSWGA